MIWWILGFITYIWLIYYFHSLEQEDYNRSARVLSTSIYNSERFTIVGNICWRIVITDNHTKLAYIFEYGELARFRRNFQNIKPMLKDKYIITAITSRVGRKAA